MQVKADTKCFFFQIILHLILAFVTKILHIFLFDNYFTEAAIIYMKWPNVPTSRTRMHLNAGTQRTGTHIFALEILTLSPSFFEKLLLYFFADDN